MTPHINREWEDRIYQDHPRWQDIQDEHRCEIAAQSRSVGDPSDEKLAEMIWCAVASQFVGVK